VAIGQLLRLREQSPQDWGRAASVGFVGDVVVQRLCGRRAHHATSLSIALLYNPYLRSADPELLAMLGVRESQLPEILPAMQAAGGLLAEISAAASLPIGIPVSAAVHDQYAAALGSGACQTGDVNFGSGTAWVLLATTDHLDYLPEAEAFACDHAIKGRYGQLFSLGNVGAVFEWALRATNMAGRSPEEIDSAMLTAAAGCGGLRCWPHVSWPGSSLSEKSRERLAELGRTLEPGRILRAVVEGLALELTRQLVALRDSGFAIRRLVMAGKASASRATPQIIADVTGLPVAIAGEGETSALGAAVLGRGLIDCDMGLDRLSAEMTRILRLIQPGPDRPAYQEMFAEYIKILPKQRAWPTP
jgi:sugar (pentulose or hexulose) kinase